MHVGAALLLFSPNALPGQNEALRVRGKLVRQSAAGDRTLAGQRVVLHKVNSRQAGPVDSVLTDRQGRYAFSVAVPDSGSMYLASARYAGIVYFAPPAQAGTPGPSAEIVVFDTTSRDVPLRVQGRHLVVSAPSADGLRHVIDVLEIENDTVVTRVTGTSNRPTFSVLLPKGAQNTRISQGDVSEGAVTVRNGRADVFASLSPGLRQMVLTYELLPAAFPLSLPLERSTGVLELLLEESGAAASGATLVSQGNVTVDGKRFLRYLGNDAPASTVVSLTVSGRRSAPDASATLPGWLVPAVLIVLTLGGVFVLGRRAAAPKLTKGPGIGAGPRDTTAVVITSAPVRRQGARATVPGSTSAEGLARHLASIDTWKENGITMSPPLRHAFAAYRADVKAQLVQLLANRDGRG